MREGWHGACIRWASAPNTVTATAVILRLWRARLRPGVEPELLARLRALVAEPPEPRPLDFTYGFRHEGGAAHFLSLSVWPDFDAILAATGGQLERPVRPFQLDDLAESTRADTYERLAPEPTRLDLAESRVIGVVTGRVKPNRESAVQAMIDRSTEAAVQAGALAAHRGRRLDRGSTEVSAVVVWPDRETLGRFVRGRDVGALDPAFTDQLTEWSFETYNSLDPSRLLLPPAGPAVVVVDDAGRYVDASPGIERVLGIPGELLIGRLVADVAHDGTGADLWQRFQDEGTQVGVIDLRRPDGRTVQVRYRAAVDVPQAGRHASVLTLPDESPDSRPIDQIVAEALDPGQVDVANRPASSSR